MRTAVRSIGFDSFQDDLASVDSKGLNCDNCEVLVRINKQSPDIAGGVHVGRAQALVALGMLLVMIIGRWVGFCVPACPFHSRCRAGSQFFVSVSCVFL